MPQIAYLGLSLFANAMFMTTTTDRYINLFTDFGFKKLFGEEPNKDLLIAFLNELLGEQEQITDLSYLKNERLGQHQGERRAVYDLYCTNDRDERFIVEVQRVKQEFFKDRSVYYSTFAVQEQAQRGKGWQYELKGVYTIAIMDFVFDGEEPEKLEHRIKLMDVATHRVFYDKLTFIYLEIPKFTKPVEALENDFDRWLFAFKNLHRLREMPPELEAGIFKKLFAVAEIARMDDLERHTYQESLKDYRDLKGAIDTSFKEGKEEGKEEGIKEGMKKGEREKALDIARSLLKHGLALEAISQITQLPLDQVKALAAEA